MIRQSAAPSEAEPQEPVVGNIRTHNLPYVTLDSDESGKQMASQLRAGLYKAAPDRVLLIGDYVSIEEAEIEDLFPQEFMAKLFTRYLQRLRAIEGDDFFEIVESGKAVIPQVEAYAAKNRILLPDAWKVDIAKLAKEALLKNSSAVDGNSCVDSWKALFLKFDSQN